MKPCLKSLKSLRVDPADVAGVALDEQTARFDFVSHEHGEGFVGCGRVFDLHLLQNAVVRIHGGFPQFLVAHFTQTLVTLDAFALRQLTAGGLAFGEHAVAFASVYTKSCAPLVHLSRYSGGMATYT